MNFAMRKRLFEREWRFVTIDIEGWTVPSGDMRPFGKLRDHHVIKAALRKLQRMRSAPFLAIGSIETVYRTVANKPVFVYKLVAQNTIEEKIELLKERKSALAASIFDHDGAPTADMTEADIAMLFEAT